MPIPGPLPLQSSGSIGLVSKLTNPIIVPHPNCFGPGLRLKIIPVNGLRPDKSCTALAANSLETGRANSV
jgi:hypothetical protein